jgi:hypothetical protein
MKNLFEITQKKAVITFGRMNPPTIGHEKLINKVMELASKNNATPFIFVSRTQDSKKNPLTSSQKIRYLGLGIPHAKKFIINDKSVRTPFEALKHVELLGYSDIIFVVGDDRKVEFKKSITPYLNHPDPNKSFNLQSFKIVSAGSRDADSDGVEGMSASKMRDAAIKNNYKLFKSGVPSNLSDKFSKEMFIDVRDGMKIIEMVEEIRHIQPSLNISRKNMPQIKKGDIQSFFEFLKTKGIQISKRQSLISSLKPTQNQIDSDKVKEKYEYFKTGENPKPFIVSSDNYILDSHHQFFALKIIDNHMKVDCFHISINMKQLLQFAKEFPKSEFLDFI